MNVRKLIQRYVRTRGNALFWGEPGVGKTAAIAAACRELGVNCELLILSQQFPTDLAGMPWVNVSRLEMTTFPPEWARRAHELGGVVFMDEINTATVDTMAAALTIISGRQVSGLSIENVAIFAAANPPETNPGTRPLLPAMANRFDHFMWKVEPTEWIDDFVSYWGAPPQIGVDEGFWAKARSLVAGFLRARPGLLHAMPKSVQQAGRAYPTPRSWDRLSRNLGIVFEEGSDIAEEAEYVTAPVGEGAGYEFMTWLLEETLPDPEDILAGNLGVEDLPSRGDRHYAVLMSVAAAACREHPDRLSRWLKAWEIISNSPQKDIAASAARVLIQGMRKDYSLPKEHLRAFAPYLKALGLI